MPQLIARMALHELQPDEDEDTHVDVISGVRRTAAVSSHANEAISNDTILRLRKLPNGIARELERKLRKCLDEFRAWTLDPPTEDVRRKVESNWKTYELQARSLLM